MLLNKISPKIQNSILIAILFLGFLVRLYRFDFPIADWHSWRQADTSAVSRNFVTSGFDLLHPKFDDLSNVPSGIDNPNGYRMVEFPIYNLFQASFFKFIGVFTLEEWGRLVTIFASLLSSIFIFLIIKERFGLTAGYLSAFFFLFIPFNIYYSRVILPDPSMVMATLGAVYFFQKWISKNKITVLNINFLLSLLFLTSAFLLRPYAIFFILPIIYLAFEKFGKNIFKIWQLWILAVLSVIPIVLWRIFILNYPEGIPASTWLFNGNNIRFRPSFFYWIFVNRIISLILGIFGLPIFLIGLLKYQKRKDLFYALSFIFSSLFYVVVLATGNVQHDYYQILIIPSIAIVLGIGSSFLLSNVNNSRKHIYYFIFIICTTLSFFVGWNYVKDYFNINNKSIIIAGVAVDKLMPKSAKVIANYNGDTSFLYQTKRKGWASFEKPLNEMIEMGASYLILVNPTKEDLQIGKTYNIVKATNEYVIFNLLERK